MKEGHSTFRDVFNFIEASEEETGFD